MPLNNSDIGKQVTLTQGTENIQGKLLSIYVSPEKVEQVPGKEQGNYESVWSAGYRVISLDVLVKSLDATSPILAGILGIATYEISGELYVLQSTTISESLSNRRAIVTLKHSQGAGTGIAPEQYEIFESFVEFYRSDGVPPDYEKVTHRMTGLVKGSPITITTQVDSLGYPSYTINLKIYKYSDDDIFFQESYNANNELIFSGFRLSKYYQIAEGTPVYQEVVGTDYIPGAVVAWVVGNAKITMTGEVGQEILEYSFTMEDYYVERVAGEAKNICEKLNESIWIPGHSGIPPFCGFDVALSEGACGIGYRWIPEHSGIPGHCTYVAAPAGTPLTEVECNADPSFIWLPEHSGIPAHCQYKNPFST